MSSLRNVNLNLLPVLRELLRKRNVTHAARELNMSQPAVSDALARLRLILHDDLLVPTGRSFVLSALAQRLQPQLEGALTEIETLLAPAAFNPAQGIGKIRVATADYVVLLVGTVLSRKLSQQAPSMSIEFVDTHLDSLSDLRMGEIDLLIAPIGQIEDDARQFNRAKLFEDDFVYLVGTHDGRPLYRPGEDISARSHVFYEPRGRPGFRSLAETLLRQRQANLSEVARVPNFLLMPFLIERTDNVALLQRRLAEWALPRTETAVIEPMEAFPRLQVMAVWNRSRENDPAHAWFRQLLLTVPAEIGLQR